MRLNLNPPRIGNVLNLFQTRASDPTLNQAIRTEVIFVNPILELIVAGRYDAAWSAFQTLEEPIALDERWAGYALAILGRGFEARDLLLRSRRRGCLEAGIELSFTQQSIGELARAQEALGRLDLETFSGLDRAFAERQSGMLALAQGEYRDALNAFERAWVSAHDDDDGAIALPGIAQALAFVCAHLGHDVRADHYYGFALERASAAMRGSLLLARAASRINLDLFDGAEIDLTSARPLLEGDAYSQASLEYHTAMLAGARGQWIDAANQFKKALQLAETVGNTMIACSAELGVASAYLELNDQRRARTHLDRAAKRCETANAQADLSMLEGEYNLRNQQPDRAIPHLERAIEQFLDLNLDRNAARAHLWLSEARLSLEATNTAAADQSLEASAVIWRALGADALLGEFQHLPLTLEHLHRHPNHNARGLYDAHRLQSQRSNAPRTNTHLHLFTLGTARLELGGTLIRLELRRAIEVFTYLLRAAQSRPEGTGMQEVLRDLFPDVPQRQARLYFHQVRYELEKKIPGLSVPYNPSARTYAVQSPFPITWDVLEFEAALSEQSPEGVNRAFKHYVGSFLPQAEGEWLETERASLNARALSAGLEWCKTWFERQQYGRCIQLATRLLEIDPLDESLNEHLVRATKALEGRVAARQTVKRLQKRFESELGSVPGTLESSQYGLEKQ
jgi:DNA-binding SARP family transcriptional activator